MQASPQNITDTITLDRRTIQSLYDELSCMHARLPTRELGCALSLLTQVLSINSRLIHPHYSVAYEPPKLLDRELAMLRLIATGHSNQEIAVMLGFTEGTIKQYLSIILRKLDARDRGHAAILATARGLI